MARQFGKPKSKAKKKPATMSGMAGEEEIQPGKTDKGRQFKLTPMSMIQLGAAVVCILVALVLVYVSFMRWRLKVNVVDGFRAYATNEISASKAALQNALKWDSNHTGSRELLAKILADNNDLKGAKRHYDTLLKQGYTRPQIYAALGVLWLKWADAASSQGKVEQYVKTAQSQFQKAGEIPEAKIGLGHCELLLSQHEGGAGRMAAAEAHFQAVRAKMEGATASARKRITRDGLIDYYSGLGRVLASQRGYDPVAASAFRACAQLTDRWMLPHANLLSYEARRLADMTLTLKSEEAKAALAIEKRMQTMWRTSRRGAELKRQWMVYALNLARAIGRSGNTEAYANLVNKVRSGTGFDKDVEPYLFDAAFKTEMVGKGHPDASLYDKFVLDAGKSYKFLSRRLARETGDATKQARACSFNNDAWVLAYRGAKLAGGGFSKYTQALDLFRRALQLYPDDYVFNRNYVVIAKRLNRKPPEYAGPLEKARAAAKGAYAPDFAKLQALLGTE